MKDNDSLMPHFGWQIQFKLAIARRAFDTVSRLERMAGTIHLNGGLNPKWAVSKASARIERIHKHYLDHYSSFDPSDNAKICRNKFYQAERGFTEHMSRVTKETQDIFEALIKIDEFMRKV